MDLEFKKMTFGFEFDFDVSKEVAERIISKFNSSKYGRFLFYKLKLEIKKILHIKPIVYLQFLK